MSVNFDSLPSDNPNGTIPKGRYHATIKSAEMKQGKPDKDGNLKAPYLNACLMLKTIDKNQGKGNMYDIISESEQPIAQYKLRRLVEALELPITGKFELKDLCKIIVGKEMLVDITIDNPKEDSVYPAKNVVDVFSGAIYYSTTDTPAINAEDAEDYVSAEPAAKDDVEY